MPHDRTEKVFTKMLLSALFYYGTLALFIYLLFPVPWNDPIFWIGAVIEIGLAYVTFNICAISRKSLDIVLILVAILGPSIYALIMKGPTLALSLIAVYVISALIFTKLNYFRYGHWFKYNSDTDMVEKFNQLIYPEYLPAQFHEHAKYVYKEKTHKVAEIVYQHKSNDAYYFCGKICIKESKDIIPSIRQKRSDLTCDVINNVSVIYRIKDSWLSRINFNSSIEVYWTYKGINFYLVAWKVDYKEVKKIVESMIR